jgi:hypothetical protein
MEERCGRRIQYVTKESEPSAKKYMTGNEQLQKALDERERFLEQNPRLRPYQAEIDRLLDSSGNIQGRMAVLGTLMQGKLLELQKQLCSLSGILIQSTTPE